MKASASRHWTGALVLEACLLSSPLACAHFQELIPSSELVTEQTGSLCRLDLVFTHPMSRGPTIDMGAPIGFGVVGPMGREDLLAKLQSKSVDGHSAYRAEYRIRQPGDYVFYLEPAPYWEPAEGKMIVHYTKVVVDAYGAEEGWDTAVGFPVEIEPLVRPYGLWTGNLFTGVVKKNGAPAPCAPIEVEWRNDGSVQAPADAFATQTLKADSAGVFSYAMPRAGWWGFAALVAGNTPLENPEGRKVPVEAGGLIWVRTRDMKSSANQ